MKRGLFLVTLLVISVLSVYLVSALWPFDAFTGRAVDNPEELCVDSDSDMNEFLAGIVIYRRSLSKRPNYRVDDCISGGRRLREYYCNDNGRIRRKTIVCEAGCEEKVTPANAFGLSLTNEKAGECISPATTCEDSDSDSEDSTLVKGTTTNQLGQRKTDSCDENTLTEYSCNDDNEIISNDVECSYRCSGGKCVEAPSTCEDSDSGNDAGTAGVTKLTIDIDSTHKKDTCEGSSIKEFYCEDGKRKSTKIKCEGICRTMNIEAHGITTLDVAYCEPQPTSCTDSDAGVDSETKGTVSVVDVYGETSTYEDKCNGKDVREYSCDGNSVKNEIVECNDICVDGACLSRGDLCTDDDDGKKADVLGTTSNVYGSFTDFCSNKKRLVEGYCKQGTNAVANSKTNPLIHLKSYTCRGGCNAGVCLQPVEETEDIE